MRIEPRFLPAIWLAIASFALLPTSVGAQCDSGTCNSAPASRVGWRGQWYVLETGNFQICCEQSESHAKDLAEHAESLRDALESKWLGKSSGSAWRPTCQILLYASKRSYVAAVGPGSEHTVGSSLVKVDKGQITSRRIDLLGDQMEFLTAALPHELTHVILRDRFTSTPPPRWADEGMATLADTQAKQGRHRRDLTNAIADRALFRAANLLAMDDYPAPNRYGTFYGESVSLTEFLVQRASPQKFVEFIEQARSEGYDAALEKCYGIAGAVALDHEWRQGVNPVQLASYYRQ
jgi:Peptidase MA superfamily